MPGHRWSHYLVVAAGYLFGAVALRAGLPEEIPPRWTVGHSTFWLGAPAVVAVPLIVWRTNRGHA